MRENCMPLGDTAPLLPEMSEALDLPSFDDDSLRCEPDEYALLIDEMRKDGVVREHRSKRGGPVGGKIACIAGKKVKDSFTGKDFVDWCAEKKMMTRERAIFLGRQIVSRRFGVNVEAEVDFRVGAT